MVSAVLGSSLVGLQRFTLFTRLPLELRFIIWRFTLFPRIVEILTSNHCTTGFYSQAALPAALHVCQESRQAVEALYPLCFGSFLQPERVRFNFDFDILYLDISQEEDGLYRLFGILKETELARLKYAAIDETYLGDGLVDSSTITGLRNAMRAMTNLKEVVVVRDITNDTSNGKEQMAFYTERQRGQDLAGWPVSVEELPDVQKKYAGWKLSQTAKMTAVYGWRGN
ncbi:hypothetical protein BKA65DRAFT_520062 [Rhexocercosporidium sp. MPI-PUGE-AT-0058]|nr:hypothetical protein BKA65DRAFT_520062 [Rhexocercosporidium sp. MPI-PUGE-AT-0058]